MKRSDPKDVLYSVINKIGKERLKIDLTADPASSRSHILDILQECFLHFGEDDPVQRGIVCEALMHFLLTALSIPSERKTGIDEIKLDIVIPSVKELKRDSNRAIVVQFIKEISDLANLVQTKTIQPNKQNIWVVSTIPVNTDCRLYSTWENPPTLAEIIIDINSFLAEKGIKGLKLLGS